MQTEAQKIKKCTQWKLVRILGLDGAYVLGWGKKQPVLVAVDLGTGEPLTIGSTFIASHTSLTLYFPTINTALLPPNAKELLILFFKGRLRLPSVT